MLKKIIVFLSILLFYGVAQADTLEIIIPVKKWDDVSINLVKYTTDGQRSCYWRYYDSLCGSWGVTFAQVNGHKGIEDINFLGVDYYLTFKGGPFWQRMGFGVGLFDRRTDEVRQGWDFHLSWQLGGMFTKNFGGFVGIGHWSDGASFAKVLQIDQFWPHDENGEIINDGGDTLGIGIRWEF